MELSDIQEQFASDWLGTAADNYEVNIVLSLEDTSRSRKDPVDIKDPYSRLNYALTNNHSKVCFLKRFRFIFVY